jgi:hypothetical protein
MLLVSLSYPVSALIAWIPMKKKRDWFLSGLNDGLAYALEAHDFVNF